MYLGNVIFYGVVLTSEPWRIFKIEKSDVGGVLATTDP